MSLSSPGPDPLIERARAGDAEALGDGGCFDAGGHAQLARDVRDMDAGRLLRHVQLGSDLAVGAARRNQGEHFGLALREAQSSDVAGVDRSSLDHVHADPGAP